LKRLLARAVGLACILTAILAAPALANTYTVTRTDDPSSGSCTPSDCSLREAINAAQANAGADTVKLKPGKTYTLTIPAGGLASFVVYRNGPLTITGHGATIDGNGAVTGTRVFDVGGSTVLKLVRVTVEGGTINDYGGGIKVETGATLNVLGGAISGNSSQGEGGGGIYNDGGMVTLHRVSVEGNQGAVSVGGGIDTASDGTTTIYDSRFFDNSIDGGGGALGSTSNAQVTVIRSQLSYNTAGDNGGAVYDSGGAHYDFANTTINNNTGANNGGGIRIFDGFVTLKNSTVTRNSAGDGGGIAVFYDGNGAQSYVTFANTILAANVDSDASGGSTPDCSDQGSGELFHSSGYNIIGDVTGCAYLAASRATGDQLGTSLSPIDPKLKNEAFNGGNFVGVETFRRRRQRCAMRRCWERRAEGR
jgi:CSLREA domain-containing protein